MKASSVDFNAFIGGQIASARKKQGITQEELSEKLGFKDRQILSNIEKGIRKVQPEELAIIIKELNRPRDYFTDVYQLPDEPLFSWRAKEKPFADATEPLARNLIAAYKRFSDLTGAQLTPIIPQLAVSEKTSYQEVASLGEYLSETYWQLGDKPACSLIDKVTSKDGLNVELFFLDMPDMVSGASICTDSFCAILINRGQSEGRRNFSLAHELFHILTWKIFHPSQFASDEWEMVRDRSEKLANSFASALLLPKNSILPEWRSQTQLGIKERLEYVAKGLKVSPDALFWRLVNLEELNKQDRPSDLEAPYSDGQMKPKPYSQKFVNMMYEVIDKGAVSVRKITSILDCNIEDLEQVFIAHGKDVPFAL